MTEEIIQDGSPQAEKFAAYVRSLSVATLTPTVICFFRSTHRNINRPKGKKMIHMKDFINLEKIKRFVSKRKVAFIASIDKEEFPNIKCMLFMYMLYPRKIDGLKTFYFSTNTSSMRVEQYRENPKACLYFYRKGLIKYQGVMLKGTMEVLEDEEIKKEV